MKVAHNLQSTIDPEQQTVLNMTYDNETDKVQSQNRGGSSVNFTCGESATITDGNGNNKTYAHNPLGNLLSLTEGGYSTAFEQNDNGLITKVTYPEGNSMAYTYDSENEEKRSKGNLLSIVENPGDRGSSNPAELSRTTTFLYENFFNQVTSVSTPNGITVTNSEQDENGNFQGVGTNIPGINYSYSYTEDGRLKSETNPFGSTKTYTYENGDGYLEQIFSNFENETFGNDVVGNLVNYSNSRGITSSYTVNEFAEVTAESTTASGSISPLNFSANYSYDKNSNLTSEEKTYGAGGIPIQNSSSFSYDLRYNMTSESDSLRGTTSYVYDANDNMTAMANALDSMSFNYDGRDLVTSVTKGQGTGAATYSFSYDGNGNMLTSTDSYGNVTSYAYDGFDRVQGVTDPLGNASIISRAEFGNLLNIKKLNSAGEMVRETIRINDPLGRMTQYTVKVPEGTDEVYTYTYADAGKTVTVTDSLARSWTVKKNDFGQVYEESDPAGNKTEYFYLDGRGNMTKKIETEKRPDGSEETHTTEYKYNAFNKVEEIKENVDTSVEAVTTFTYDPQGNLSGTIDAEGNTISHKYDSVGRKTSTKKHFKDGSAVTTSFTYYANDLLKTITDSHGNTTTYNYDDQKRLTKITYPDESEITYNHTTTTIDNMIYRKVVETQRNGTEISSIFDPLNRLKNRQINRAQGVGGTTTETYKYDALSRLTEATNDNFTIERKYDSLNRITQEKQMFELINYTYSVVDNRRKMSIQYPNGRIIERDFDILDRVSKIRQDQETITDYAYIGKAYRMLSKQYGNGDAINFLYDQRRRMTTIDAKNSAQTLINKYVYGYNKVNMKTFEQRVHDSNNGDIFSYDEVYRLKNIKFNSPEPTVPETDQFEKQKTYLLDKVDNILKVVENQGEQTSEILTTSEDNQAKLNQYTTFDQWGLSYDDNGNTTQKGTQHFTYDYRNQLISAQDLSTTVDYKYDPFGRRAEKIIDSNTTKYLYHGNQVIEERDGSDQVLKQYIYGNGIDEVIRMDSFESGNPAPYYFHTDAIGSVTAITDNSGNLIERVSYDTFGMPTFTDPTGETISTSTIDNEYLFQGRRYDKETNLYYYRARYYDPIMGRFLQTDPLGYQDSMNMYQSFNTNPVNFVDPWGEFNIRIDTGGGKYLDMASGWGTWGKVRGESDSDEIIYNYDEEIKISDRLLMTKDGYTFVISLDEAYNIAQSVNMGLDFVPVIGTIKGIVEAFSGQDFVGNDLELWERFLSIPGVTDSILLSYKIISKGVTKSSKIIDSVSDIAKKGQKGGGT
ncbi:RHS repeat-associated core domain-containing protein [Acidobacteriota bacterium]